MKILGSFRAEGPILYLSLSNQKTFVIFGGKRFFYRFDLPELTCSQHITLDAYFQCSELSKDDRFLLMGDSTDLGIFVYSTREFSLLKRISTNGCSVDTMLFLSGKPTLIAGLEDANGELIVIWNLSEDSRGLTVKSKCDFFCKFALRKNEKSFFSGGMCLFITEYCVETLKVLHEVPVDGDISSLLVSPDDQWLFAGSVRGSLIQISLLDYQTFKIFASPEEGSIESLSLTFDEKDLIMGLGEGFVALLGESKRSLGNLGSSVVEAVALDGQKILAASFCGLLVVIEVNRPAEDLGRMVDTMKLA